MPVDGLELRNAAAASTEGGMLAGYAAIFNSPANIGDSFIETIAPGAFARSISRGDVLALLDHSTGRVIGRKSAGTLRIGEDAKGLWVEIDPPNSPDGWTARELVGRSDLRGMSIGFRVRRESWDDTGRLPTRRLEEVELHEVSIVAFPAYEDTSIALRSLTEARKQTNASSAMARIRRKAETEMKIRGLK